MFNKTTDRPIITKPIAINITWPALCLHFTDYCLLSTERQERHTTGQLASHHHQSIILNGKGIVPIKEKEIVAKASQLTMPGSEVYKSYHKEKDVPEADSTKKQYLCDICRKSFQQVCQLKQHRRIHTGIVYTYL